MERLRIALFAAGRGACEYINHKHDIEIVAIFDNDRNRWGELFCGFEIQPPQCISENEFDYLVITTPYYEGEIRSGLIDNFPALTERICSVSKMNYLEYTYREYRKRYHEKNEQQYSVENKKIVIYTGIFGHYDILLPPLYRDEGVDYICYTDDKSLTSSDWEIRYVECEQENTALEVRKYKCLPHRFLPEYDVSVWIDANIQIQSSILSYIEENMQNTGMLFFPHYERNCIYEEGAINILLHKENAGRIIEQMYEYSQEQYPEHNGLFCGGFIVREHNRKMVATIMEEWYAEVLKHSLRDQISLPYVLWRNEVRPDICWGYFNDNQYTRVYEHTDSSYRMQ